MDGKLLQHENEELREEVGDLQDHVVEMREDILTLREALRTVASIIGMELQEYNAAMDALRSTDHYEPEPRPSRLDLLEALYRAARLKVNSREHTFEWQTAKDSVTRLIHQLNAMEPNNDA